MLLSNIYFKTMSMVGFLHIYKQGLSSCQTKPVTQFYPRCKKGILAHHLARECNGSRSGRARGANLACAVWGCTDRQRRFPPCTERTCARARARACGCVRARARALFARVRVPERACVRVPERACVRACVWRKGLWELSNLGSGAAARDSAHPLLESQQILVPKRAELLVRPTLKQYARGQPVRTRPCPSEPQDYTVGCARSRCRCADVTRGSPVQVQMWQAVRQQRKSKQNVKGKSESIGKRQKPKARPAAPRCARLAVADTKAVELRVGGRRTPRSRERAAQLEPRALQATAAW